MYLPGFFAREEGKNSRSKEYTQGPPISTCTCHAWMVELGSSFHRTQQPYYSESLERAQAKMQRGGHVREASAGFDCANTSRVGQWSSSSWKKSMFEEV